MFWLTALPLQRRQAGQARTAGGSARPRDQTAAPPPHPSRPHDTQTLAPLLTAPPPPCGDPAVLPAASRGGQARLRPGPSPVETHAPVGGGRLGAAVAVHGDAAEDGKAAPGADLRGAAGGVARLGGLRPGCAT